MTKMTTLKILKDVSGIIRPSRMTLLLGPPSSGKTTLLKAFAGKLDPSLKVSGEITYNGYRLDEFVPQKTAAYVSQNDTHMGEMTVKEILDFSASCQGVGHKYDLLTELAKREKEEMILPETDVDLFMKATAMGGGKSGLQTDYTTRILGLDICADTIIGDEMRRGISGGQKKRVTTGEMIVGPTKTLFMDEISNGLDSATTFQIVKCLQQIVHLGEATILMSLLQPDPETFQLFDDIILLAEGQIIYQGPRESVLDFFETCGFQCPERKGAADFLQEVTSRKDQGQYWVDKEKPYRYISVSEFAAKFKNFHIGLHLENELSIPFSQNARDMAALVFTKQSVSNAELLKASFSKEWLLMKRNSFIYVFSTIQIVIIGMAVSSIFFRTQMHTNSRSDGQIYIGALLVGMCVNMFNGFAEQALTLQRLPVVYKHRDLLFHPPWIFTFPNFLIRMPISIVESIAWVLVTYYLIGFAPEASRFFKQLLLFFLTQQTASGVFRFTAGILRSQVITTFGGSLILLVIFVLAGFLIPKALIPDWWIWAYWLSPLTYAYNALAVNEMLAPRWMNKFTPDGRRLGHAVLEDLSISTDGSWYWIGAGGLLGFAVLFNVLFTLSLMYLNPLGKPQAIIPVDKESEGGIEETDDSLKVLVTRTSTGEPTRESNNGTVTDTKKGFAPKKVMVLPFTPLIMSFDEVEYYVDMPVEMKEQGVTEDKLQLLRGVTGSFRPGVLTALMGVSGAGKTTLMDVLAGRKTGGYIEGDIRISGYPKKQETFARVSGYCEQNDIHSPQLTIRESLIYSAFLRLPKEVKDDEKMKFIEEVMELVELDNHRDAIVGLPDFSGLSTQQRKRLTIAVELVANPSIIFMDEPTSGLDARAAAIVMRTVRNTVDTGRTVVCTIHLPSIDIFEAFDELLLMKIGGQVIYLGPLGQNSQQIIEYFGAIPGVPKIKDKQNPATWMLEVTSSSTEARLGIDLTEYYSSSSLHQHNKQLVKELSQPSRGTSEICFPTEFARSHFTQFKLCVWKQWWSYWRNPDYNILRLLYGLLTGIFVGSVFWKIGNKRDNANDLVTIIGAMFIGILYVGVNNCVSVLPVIAVERTVFYREKAAGMYSSLSYAIAQVVVEIPYVLIQSAVYVFIIYGMMGFPWTADKFFWFLFICFFTHLTFTYYGMMILSISPNHQIAVILASSMFAFFIIFSGFFVPRPSLPPWWRWYPWFCPISWSVYGLIVSQYGNDETIIRNFEQQQQSIKEFIKDYFGYNPDFMGVVAIALVVFSAFFALVFAVGIKKLNFQQR